MSTGKLLRCGRFWDKLMLVLFQVVDFVRFYILCLVRPHFESPEPLVNED